MEARVEELSAAGLAWIDREVEAFERLASDRGDVALRPYWTGRRSDAAPGGLERLTCLGALIKADLRRRFDRGETPSVRQYLDDFPEIGRADSRVLSLIYEEFCLREERGESLDVESFCDRYPDWKDSLVSQLGYHRLLSRAAGLAPPKPVFPEVGETFEEFTLLARIGRGGYSRVFLASDHSLGGKRVVLKVAIDRGREAETQGALDHPHIVPVNSVVYRPANGLQALSMPYRPGLPLDEIVRRLRGGGRPRTAMAIWDALVSGIESGGTEVDAESARSLRGGPVGDGWRGFPTRGGFARGAAWIAMTIARALAYAHENRTYHRDVKPGNVLLTLRHGPQLLDFNLARSPHSPREARAAIQGGTLPYMAPEQIEAFLDPERWDDVGAAADVYSLGLVLRELLTGEAPDVPDSKLPPPRALRDMLDRRSDLAAEDRRHHPGVPHALEAIVRKCLRPKPGDRYRGAAELAEDLQRMLRRRPTVHVANPSRVERLRDWAARNRRVLVANAVYLSVLAVLSPLLVARAALLLRPDVEDRPELKAATRALDAHDPATAVRLLDALAREYPDSPVPVFYLGLAQTLAHAPAQDPGRANYRAAVKSAWTTDTHRLANAHANLPNLLVEVGEEWVDDAGALAVKIDRDPDAAAGESLARIRELAEHALRTALELNPGLTSPLHALATLDESRADFEAARDKLSRLLATPSAAAPVKPDPYGPMTWRIQRARVVVQLVNRLETKGPSKDPDRLLKLMDEAAADLNACGADGVPDFLGPVYESIRAEVFLTRGALRCRLGDKPGADADVREADQAVTTWFDAVRLVGMVVPREQASRYQDRLRALQNCVAGPNDPG